MKIAVGSYERFVFGYDAPGTEQLALSRDNATPSITGSFTYAAHSDHVRSLACSGSLLATGGGDDTIRIFDMKKSRDLGSLIKHEGAVTCLEFYGAPNASHLLSGGDDGTLVVWGVAGWRHLKTLAGHKGAVHSVSVHPSGKLALSTSRDRHLRMWNLIKGKSSYSFNLRAEGEIVLFAPRAGDSYSMVAGDSLAVFSTETGSETARLQGRGKLLSLCQDQDKLLVTGGENKCVDVFDSGTRGVALSFRAHTSRIKGLSIPAAAEGSGNTPPPWIVSGSSDGFVRIWDTRMLSKNKGGGGADAALAAPLAELQTKARIVAVGCSEAFQKGNSLLTASMAAHDEGEAGGEAEEGDLPVSPTVKEKAAQQARKKRKADAPAFEQERSRSAPQAKVKGTVKPNVSKASLGAGKSAGKGLQERRVSIKQKERRADRVGN
eukprot:jgi/Mesvir1/420/Mv11303-RA.1